MANIDFAFHCRYVCAHLKTRKDSQSNLFTTFKPFLSFMVSGYSERKELFNMCWVYMTLASKSNLCICTYHTLVSHQPTILRTHTKQNLFKRMFLFPWCLQESLLPLVLLMLWSYLIVEGVSYRSLADNADGQCPSQGSCLGLRLNSPAH